MIFIGISEEHDAGVCVVRDGRVIFALNEERLSRKKLHMGFPTDSMKLACTFLHDRELRYEVRGIALGSQIHIGGDVSVSEKPHLGTIVSRRAIDLLSRLKLTSWVVGTSFGVEITRPFLRFLQRKRVARIRQRLDEQGLGNVPFRAYDHHLCHAVSAFFSSGFSECLALTVDAAGDGYASRAYRCVDGRMELLHSIPFYHSIGHYYELVTLILGFKFGQAGKVTGLSARGDASRAIDTFRSRIRYNPRRMIFENFGNYYLYERSSLASALSGFSREDVSAAVQQHLEDVVVSYVDDLLRKYFPGGRQVNVALAGGVFANVLLNGAISRIDEVGRLFVHPHMGDGGLATGAALEMSRERSPGSGPYELQDVYLGPELSKTEVEEALRCSGLPYRVCDEIEKEVAARLAAKKVVARVEGRLEYGPRALGHRSILYHAGDSSVNDWLNTKLSRSEFMPFAPAILADDADEYFELGEQHRCATFMTIACPTTEKCRRLCPAVIHVDGTARPQVVFEQYTPSFYRIIAEYKPGLFTGKTPRVPRRVLEAGAA